MFKQLVCILLVLNIAMAAKVNRHNSADDEKHEAAPAVAPAATPAAGGDKPAAAGAAKPAAGTDKPATPAKPAEPSKNETLLKEKCKPELDACKQVCVDTLTACKPQAQRSGIAGYNQCIGNNEEAKKLIACFLKNK